ncbi:uncharacterized protein LOC144918411 [Branchiostoma floridae x Branchiostoma belcheri]
MRDQIKLEMETIDQQLDPYVHDEDDPCVREIEAKRAQAVRQLFENIAQLRKEFISLLVEECIGLMGPTPCKYALLGLGSQATGLVTPYSDLEFAILVEDESEQHKVYFRNLTHYLHLKVVNLGETILPALGIKSLNDFYSGNPLDNWYYDSVTPRGFAFDGSMPKASKTPLGRQGTKNKPPSELIHTPSNMVSILQNDVTVYLKEGYHLATVLRNPCLIAGDQGLINTYMAITGKILQADGGKMAKQLAQETMKEDMMRYSPEETIKSKLTNVKKDIYRFPAVAVDCLALSLCIVPTTVWETIEEMENQQVISPSNAHHLTVLTSISAELRLRTYIANGGQKENLSAMASMETVLDEKKSANDKEHTAALQAVFHIPNEKQLFRYFYSSNALKLYLSLWPQDCLISESVLKFDFYDSSPSSRGMMYSELCKYRLAIHFFEKALNQKEGNTETTIATLLFNLGISWYQLGEYETAISYHERALKMQKCIYGWDVAHSDIARSLNNLGMACNGLGDYKKSTTYLEQALQMCKTIHGQRTKHPRIADILSHLGLASFSLGDHKKAISYHEQALDMYRSVYGPSVDHADIARALNILAQTWNELGDFRKSIEYLKKALQMRKRIYGDNTAHPDIAVSLNNLGIAYDNSGDYERAKIHHEQALAMRRSIYGETAENPHIARSLNNLGSVWSSLKNNSKAESYFEQALQMRRNIYGQDAKHPEIFTSLVNMGQVRYALGDHGRTIHFFEQALQVIKFLHDQNTEHPKIAFTLSNLGAVWIGGGDPGKATGYLTEALQMYRRIYGQDTAHPHVARCLNVLGKAWLNLCDNRKAIYYLQQALEMNRSIYGQGTPHLAIALSLTMLGISLCNLGNHMKAKQILKEALSMARKLYPQDQSPPLVNEIEFALAKIQETEQRGKT